VHKTRRSILEFLKQHGRASLDDLAQDAGLAPMSVRGHLAVLERDGLISYEEVRGRVGRPRFMYSLTDLGQDEFPKSYHTLCNRILDAISTSSLGPSDLASKLADVWTKDHEPRLAGKSFEDQLKILTTIRTEEGAMASLEKTPEGFVLHQQHCPASCVAARHPNVICTAEIGFIRRVLGTTVERVSWKQKGDATCSYRIRAPQPDTIASSTTPITPAFVVRPAPAE
jgi:DeoR family suf operon transcriptional repressor